MTILENDFDEYTKTTLCDPVGKLRVLRSAAKPLLNLISVICNFRISEFFLSAIFSVKIITSRYKEAIWFLFLF